MEFVFDNEGRVCGLSAGTRKFTSKYYDEVQLEALEASAGSVYDTEMRIDFTKPLRYGRLFFHAPPKSARNMSYDFCAEAKLAYTKVFQKHCQYGIAHCRYEPHDYTENNNTRGLLLSRKPVLSENPHWHTHEQYVTYEEEQEIRDPKAIKEYKSRRYMASQQAYKIFNSMYYKALEYIPATRLKAIRAYHPMHRRHIFNMTLYFGKHGEQLAISSPVLALSMAHILDDCLRANSPSKVKTKMSKAIDNFMSNHHMIDDMVDAHFKDLSIEDMFSREGLLAEHRRYYDNMKDQKFEHSIASRALVFGGLPIKSIERLITIIKEGLSLKEAYQMLGFSPYTAKLRPWAAAVAFQEHNHQLGDRLSPPDSIFGIGGTYEQILRDYLPKQAMDQYRLLILMRNRPVWIQNSRYSGKMEYLNTTWVAKNYSSITGKSMQEKKSTLSTLGDWIDSSYNQHNRYAHLITRRFTMDMSFTRAQDLSRRWHDALVREDRKRREQEIEQERKIKFPAPWASYHWEDGRYAISYITNAGSLLEEGLEMAHCVGGYSTSVLRNWSQVYSLTFKGERRVTIEVRPKENGHIALGQVQAYKNTNPPNKEMNIIRKWLNEHQTTSKEQLLKVANFHKSYVGDDINPFGREDDMDEVEFEEGIF